MLATILDSGDTLSRSNYLAKLGIPITHHLAPDPSSIGIKAVQDLVQTLSISTNTARLVWVEGAETLTVEASNALLKLLEEPPTNTHIYLTCPSALALLPTIRSRCQIVSLKDLSSSLLTSYLPSLKPLLALSPGDRLAHTSDFPTDRAELVTYFAALAAEIHTTITTTKTSASLSILRSLGTQALESYDALKRNSSPSLTLAHFLLHLPITR